MSDIDLRQKDHGKMGSGGGPKVKTWVWYSEQLDKICLWPVKAYGRRWVEGEVVSYVPGPGFKKSFKSVGFVKIGVL